MKLKNIGEQNLVENIKRKIRLYSKDVIAGIGDDAAVLKYDKKNYLLFTTDMLFQDVHFSLKYSTPEQIGAKAVEQNVSDIAAMGGVPKFALVSIALPKKLGTNFLERLYSGINKKAEKYKIDVVGGNICRSKEIAVSVALIGFVEKKHLALRSGAKEGDLILSTGDAGASAAGLELLRQNKKGKSVKRHLEPQSRLDLARKLVKTGVSSMADVSDGIASEVRHICRASEVGAVIYADKIPASKNTIHDSRRLNKNPIDFALYGGEDFELVFTIGRNKRNQMKKFDVAVIGEIVGKKYGVKLIKNSRILKLRQGFDHFRQMDSKIPISIKA